MAVVGILFSFEWGARGFETDGLDEDIEIIDDALVKALRGRCGASADSGPIC